MNIYAPSILKDQINCFKYLKTFTTKHSKKNSALLIAKDFNCNVDKVNLGDSRDISAEYINMLKTSLDVTYIWVYCYPDDIKYTIKQQNHLQIRQSTSSRSQSFNDIDQA